MIKRNKTVITLKDSVVFDINTPLISLDVTKMLLTDKDSLAIAFKGKLHEKENAVILYFDKKEEQNYKVEILPEAFTDFFGNVNDSLQFNFKTKMLSDYGTINVTLQNLNNRNTIVQIVNERYEVIQEKVVIADALPKAFFENLDPALYYIRIILDENNNGVWDTGDFLSRKTPEKVIYYPAQVELKPNWSLEEIFILD